MIENLKDMSRRNASPCAMGVISCYLYPEGLDRLEYQPSRQLLEPNISTTVS